MHRPKSKPTKTTSIRFRGPLAPFTGELEAQLRRLGYTPLTTASLLRLYSHLSRWLEANGLDTYDLSSATVERYLAVRRESGRTFAFTAGSLAPLMAMLAESGVQPAVDRSERPTPNEELLASFERYLRVERALASETTGAYLTRARRFLEGCGGIAGLGALGATDVTAAVLRQSAVSVGSAQYLVAALRAFLRYLFLSGLVDNDLSSAALAVTGRRHSCLPTGISHSEAEALLRSCDSRRADGRRDFAVLSVLIRLGLRASEVAGLRLDDVDWRAGEITVAGKGGRLDPARPAPAPGGSR